MPDYKSKSIILAHGVFGREAFHRIRLDKGSNVFICEGRPDLEAGKSNAKALLGLGITPTLICDNMMGFLFFKGFVNKVYLACQYADHSGALCDTGALICAVLAKRHKVPVKLLPGRTRARFLGNPRDVLSFQGIATAPARTHAYAPLVEWVPGKYLI